MATTVAAVTPPTLTAEASPSVVPPAPEEPQDLTPLTNHQSDTPPQSQELETLTPAVPSPPLFINSISELKGLSAAITAFQECYEDLHNHLDSIKAAILSKVPLETPLGTSSVAPSSLSNLDVCQERMLQKQQQEQNPPKSELEGLCKMMCSRGIRKYLASNLSHLEKLREEVPKALKLAPNPPKLVLECLGKFFLQGSKAFTRNSPMIPAREASILILECFLLMMGMDITNEKDNGVLDIEKAVREEAETAALAWRKRLVFEGGVAKASQIDARGLLLFVACFGVPASFKREDIRDLVIAANAKEIVGVLQKSQTLMKKIPGGAFFSYEFGGHVGLHI
ncbi:UNVERIFIED_CONTAM: protein FRIGIDA [Sesamum latifolium]|uniref:FRIGIDA-like protein n=1 Tax=Sesamum latifolium TaxID=2727402 RepID=A0AAW2UGM2_9LAMI